MKRMDFEFIVSALLIVSLCVTGALGYIQSELELRRFVPHRYAAYTTLFLAALHVGLNGERLWHYLRRFKKTKPDRNAS